MAEPAILELRGLNLWDGNKRIDETTLTLQSNRILAVGASEYASAADRTIDATGLWAIPGLIDAHVHMTLDPSRREPPAAGEVPAWEPMVERAEQMARAGITTARDLGGGVWRELELRDAINRGEVAGPTLYCTGQPVTSPGGHCHFWGGEAASISDIESIINRQQAHGVDLIKVMASGGVMTRASKPSAAQFEQAELDALVRAARRHGYDVAAHCHSTTAIDRSVHAGVHTVEHCSWVSDAGWGKGYDPAIAERMAATGIWVSPTINLGWKRHLDNPDTTRRDQLRAIFASMRDRGVPLIASTDAGIPGVQHQDLPRALPIFASLAGLSSEEALQSATSNAADALRDTQAGRLAAGKRADLLLFEHNPLDDLGVLANPVEVVLRGRPLLGALSQGT